MYPIILVITTVWSWIIYIFSSNYCIYKPYPIILVITLVGRLLIFIYSLNNWSWKFTLINITGGNFTLLSLSYQLYITFIYLIVEAGSRFWKISKKDNIWSAWSYTIHVLYNYSLKYCKMSNIFIYSSQYLWNLVYIK